MLYQSFFIILFSLQKNEFKMYTIYCKNRPGSEALWEEIGGIEHPFFLECQSKLKHQLPLNSYLIKPVQRITKYGLLLKVCFWSIITNIANFSENLNSYLNNKCCYLNTYLNGKLNYFYYLFIPGFT